MLSGLMKSRSEELFARQTLYAAETERDIVQDLYENAPCGYHTLDAHGRIARINQTLLNWLGYQRLELLGQPFEQLLSPSSKTLFREKQVQLLEEGLVEDLELNVQRRDGQVLPVVMNSTIQRDDTGRFVVTRATVFDISERKKLEAQLLQLARTDTLTGLHNRREFEAQSEKEITRCARFHAPLALLLIDVDHFKRINDTQGHQCGDDVLKTISVLFKSELRDTDTLARIGGEEFAVLMPMCDRGAAQEAAERLRKRVAQQHFEGRNGQDLQVTISIGISTHRATDQSIGPLLKRADQALYEAKASGRNLTIAHQDLPVEMA